jgi:homoserine O-succinyltransferase
VPTRLASAESLASDNDDASTTPVGRTLSFVNNMPDGAFDDTERQFLRLVDEGSGDEVINVTRHTLKGVPRGNRIAARIADDYRPVSDIVANPPDLLLVTGSNPIESEIREEPYYTDLVDLLTWARDHVPSMLLSCLSAHAAVTVFDGIERYRLPTKRTGVFAQHVDTGHPLTANIGASILLPHSRYNSVPEDGLREAGYVITIESDIGWSVASRLIGSSDVVLVQGHPEYDPSSLLREYRRDVGRYVRHERDDLPCLPYHCVNPDDWDHLEEMHHEIINGHRDPALIDTYPFDDVGARAPWPWRDAAVRLYTNWLSHTNEVRD